MDIVGGRQYIRTHPSGPLLRSTQASGGCHKSDRACITAQKETHHKRRNPDQSENESKSPPTGIASEREKVVTYARIAYGGSHSYVRISGHPLDGGCI